MSFHDRLAAVRKQRGLTQQALADAVGVHLTQVGRYEAGSSLPHFEVLRKLVIALGVSADYLLFEERDRNPDDDLRSNSRQHNVLTLQSAR